MTAATAEPPVPLSRFAHTNFLPEADELGHVTSLQLFLHNKKDCQTAGTLLERVQRIRSLAIVLNDTLLDFGASDTGAAGLAVINSIFDSGNVSRSCPGLRRLRI